MADTLKRYSNTTVGIFGSQTLLATAGTAGGVVRNIHFCNTSSSPVRVWMSIGTSAYDATKAIYSAFAIPAYGVHVANTNIVLGASEKLYAYASTTMSPVVISSYSTSSDSSVYTSSTFDMTAGRLYLIQAVHTQSTPASFTLSGGSGFPTWTSRVAATFNTTYRASLWSAVPTTDYTGSFTITPTAAASGIVFQLFEITGVDTSVTDGIVQTVTSAAATTTTPSATLAALSDANNGSFGFAYYASSTATFTPGASYSEINEASTSTPAQAIASEFAVPGSTTVNGTLSLSTSSIMAAMELKRAPSVVATVSGVDL